MGLISRSLPMISCDIGDKEEPYLGNKFACRWNRDIKIVPSREDRQQRSLYFCRRITRILKTGI